MSRTNLGRYLEGQGHIMTLQQNRVRSITLLFENGFYNYFTEMITILRWHVAHIIWVATLKVRVTTSLAAKLYPALFTEKNHPIETQCRKQDLCRYLKGQGHSMTLQQKRVRPITLLFEVGFYNFLTEMITTFDDVSLPCPLFGYVRTILHYTK